MIDSILLHYQWSISLCFFISDCNHAVRCQAQYDGSGQRRGFWSLDWLLSNWDLAFSRQVECPSCNMPNPSVKRNKYTFS